MEDRELIRPAGAARRAGVSLSTVHRWIRDGKLGKYKDARGRVWVDGRAVDALSAPVPASTVTEVGT